MADLARALLLPPGINFILLALGFLLLPLARKLAGWLIGFGIALLYLLSIAPVAGFLIGMVETTPALSDPVTANDEGAIVVLGAGRYDSAPEYGNRNTAGQLALMRLRYAERLREQTGLPILVSGGSPRGERQSEAELMERTLQDAFEGLARWTEQKSRNTFENAICSQFILDGQAIDKAFLVTHAAHMPRAVYAFKKTGLKVTPAPTGYLRNSFKHADAIETWLPNMGALQLSRTALHEWLGLIYYKMVYGGTESATGVQARC